MSVRFEFWIISMRDKKGLSIPDDICVKISATEFRKEFDNIHELKLIKYIKSLGPFKKKISLRQAKEIGKAALVETLGLVKNIANARNVPGRVSTSNGGENRQSRQGR